MDLLTLPIQPLLFEDFARFELIEGHVPVDSVLIVLLLLVGVVHDRHRLRVVRINAFKASLLDQLPGQLILVLLGHLFVLRLDLL